MAVYLCYNNKIGNYYAYEVTTEYDEATDRKVTHRRCVGHLDPDTGEIVPNGKRGRPRAPETTNEQNKPNPERKVNATSAGLSRSEYTELLSSINRLEKLMAKTLAVLSENYKGLGNGIGKLVPKDKKSSNSHNSEEEQVSSYAET